MLHPSNQNGLTTAHGLRGRFGSEHLEELRPRKLSDAAGQERFQLSAIRELRGSLFELCRDEVKFVLELLDGKTRPALRKHNLWVFRSHQAMFAGDFVVVDISGPRRWVRDLCFPDWDVFVLDLKQRAPLRLGGGGAGFQLVRAEEAARVALRVAAERLLPQAARAGPSWMRALRPHHVWRLVGDRAELLEFFRLLRHLRRVHRRTRKDEDAVLRAFRRLSR